MAETAPSLNGMRIFLAGDSRSSTDYTFYKEILEQKTGSVVLVEGASGCTVAYNASDAYFTRVAEQEHDFSIWLVGGNDPGEAGPISPQPVRLNHVIAQMFPTIGASITTGFINTYGK